MDYTPSNKAILENEVWVFPIYKYGTKKYIPFKFAFPIAYIVPTLLIILLSPLSYNNAFIFQIEFILVALCYGLLGILTRSKLRSLLNVIPAILSYITVEFIVQGLLKFYPPINDPYGGFTIASGPVTAILKNFGYANYQLGGYLFIVDILIITLIAEIGGFFTAVLSTGFWNPRGQFSVIAVIAKIIAIPFVLILIIVFPIFMHGFSSLVTGGSYLGAGFSELDAVYTNPSGAVAAQSSFNLSNINIAYLRQHSLKAAQDFNLAYAHLNQLGNNFIVQGLISAFVNSYPQYAGFRNITNILALVESMSEVTYVLPELYLGFQSLQNGFQDTMPLIVKNSPTYDPAFNTGLKQLGYAFGNFSLAYNKSINGQQHGIKEALIAALPLQDIQSLSNYIDIGQFFGALQDATLALLQVKEPFVQFLNGTYMTTIAMKNLENNNFNASEYWMNQGIDQFIKSNTTLANIPTPPVVEFTIHSKGDGGASGDNQTIQIPIDGVVKIAKDMNNMLIRFAYAGLSGIDVFQGMDNVMTSMNHLDWNLTAQAASVPYWNALTYNLTLVNNDYHLGVYNITEAGNLATQDSKKSYGSLLDPTFVQGPNSFFGQFSKQITDLSTKFIDYAHVLDAFTNTTIAMKNFAFGSNSFFSWLTSSSSSDKNDALGNFSISMNHAYLGYLALSNTTTSLSPTVTANWEATLFSPTNNGTLSDTSITGADYTGIVLLNTTPQPANNYAILNIILGVQLADILGSG